MEALVYASMSKHLVRSFSARRTGVPEHGLTKAVDRVDTRGSTDVQLMFFKHIGKALNVQRHPNLMACR